MRFSRRLKKDMRKAFEAHGLEADLRFPRNTRTQGFWVAAAARSRALDGLWISNGVPEVPGDLPRFSGQVVFDDNRYGGWGIQTFNRRKTIDTATGEAYDGTPFTSAPGPREAAELLAKRLSEFA